MGIKNESKTKYILISRQENHGKQLEFENYKFKRIGSQF